MEIGNVVDEPAAPASRPANGLPGHRQRDERLGVDDLGVRCRGGDGGRPLATAPDGGEDFEATPERSPEPIAALSPVGRQHLGIRGEPDRPEKRPTDEGGQGSQATGNTPVEDDPAQLDPLGQGGRRRQPGTREGHDRHGMAVLGEGRCRLEQARFVFERVGGDDRDPEPARDRPGGRHREADADRTGMRPGARTGSRTWRRTAAWTAATTRASSSWVRPAYIGRLNVPSAAASVIGSSAWNPRSMT